MNVSRMATFLGCSLTTLPETSKRRLGQVIFRGVGFFLLGNRVECVGNKRIRNGEEGAVLKRGGGRRAEDPFRGLRAGPVRFSPIAFPAV
jgi:hypothetical protein